MAGKIGVTFKDSKVSPIHRWYPYVEGFSATWVGEMLDEYYEEGMVIYDPFGGSGTTNLEASKRGIKSYYSETNPFMRFILETKINTVKEILLNKTPYIEEMRMVEHAIQNERSDLYNIKKPMDGIYDKLLDKKYFEEQDLLILSGILGMLNKGNYSKPVETLVKCAVSCIAVDTSNMTRRADLRRRRDNEYINRVVDVRRQFLCKWNEFIEDILLTEEKLEEVTCVSLDARVRTPKYDNKFDFVITSPPYINGTNYIRNTTLELFLAGFVDDENGLKMLRNNTVCGGISDASSSRYDDLITFPIVEEIGTQLDELAKDKRIPIMVRCYFSDMYKVLVNIYYIMKKNAKFVLDIGDSKFYDVYVPTDMVLIELAKSIGFKIISLEKIAQRFSRDKTELKQVVITLQK